MEGQSGEWRVELVVGYTAPVALRRPSLMVPPAGLTARFWLASSPLWQGRIIWRARVQHCQWFPPEGIHACRWDTEPWASGSSGKGMAAGSATAKGTTT